MMAAAGHTVKRTRLGWNLSALEVARLVRADARPFALIGRWAQGGAIIGSEPVRVAREDEDPFALLDAQPLITPAPTDDAEPDAVGGGWVGYLGYGLGRRLERISAPPPSPTALPPHALAFYDHVLHQDAAGSWWFEALETPDNAPRLAARLSALQIRAASPLPAARTFTTTPWVQTPGRSGHERAVAACRARIHAGDLFQANVCVRLDATFSGDPLDLFLAGVDTLRPDRAAYVSGPWGAVASLSPELFLERIGDHVRSAPIKGTVRKPADPEHASRAREALRASEKDRAENIMIVDLVRNDLGRVCRPGTVAADVLADARAHTGVWHLVSEVSGQLQPGARNEALVRAAFPPGSVTGAPKVAALNVIAELESTRRDVYTGAIGFASPVAERLELSVAIRTFEFSADRRRVWLGVGGGIVADSDPAAEAAECLTKAAPLLRAIGAGLAPVAGLEGPRHHVMPHRRAPMPVPRPDPAAGVFETVLVADGRPVALAAHLARLRDSVGTLYGQSLPSDLGLRLAAVAAATPHRARLRVNARPTRRGSTVTIELELSEVPVRTAPPRLFPVAVPGGLGAHKWIDRRLLDAVTASAPTGAHPLICDLDGDILETPRASVFIVTSEQSLVTPPADERTLPGVTRADVLRVAEELGITTETRPLRLGELDAASEVFLTGSLAGVEPAIGPREEAFRHPPKVAETLRTKLYKTAAPAILR